MLPYPVVVQARIRTSPYIASRGGPKQPSASFATVTGMFAEQILDVPKKDL